MPSQIIDSGDPGSGQSDDPVKEKRQKAKVAYERAKELVDQEEYYEACDLLKKAIKLHPESAKYKKRLEKLEEYLESLEDESDEDDDDFLERLEKSIARRKKRTSDDASNDPSPEPKRISPDSQKGSSPGMSSDNIGVSVYMEAINQHNMENIDQPLNSTMIPSRSVPSLEEATEGLSIINVSDDEKINNNTRRSPDEFKPKRDAFSILMNPVKKEPQEASTSKDLDSSNTQTHSPSSSESKVASQDKAKEVDDDEFVELCHGLEVQACYFKKLYPYQLDGIKWILSLYLKEDGGILADDMGLGKTIQTIIAISALMRANKIKNTLIVAPATLLLNWGEEFKKWAPHIKVYQFHGAANQRKRDLATVQERGGVLVTTYGLIVTQVHNLNTRVNGMKFTWDYVVIDEAHKIKNPTKTTTAMLGLNSKVRLGITGTPVQNNLKELFNLYRWVSQGTLFGDPRSDDQGMGYAEFKDRFENPILKSREKDASDRVRMFGIEAGKRLLKLYERLFLRRTKEQVLRVTRPGESIVNSPLSLPPKIDLAAWIRLSTAQIKVYQDFLRSPELKAKLLTTQSPLTQLVILKKLCDHPRLLSSRSVHSMIENNRSQNQDQIENLLDDDGEDVTIDTVSDEHLIMESGKLGFCLNLIEFLRAHGHRTLLFSQSTKMLDIIQRILVNRGYRLLRLDGRVTKMSERQKIVNLFQKDSSFSLCLLTSQVGGVGLTLTAADRVIIYDPSWNPGVDNQAIDRAYRIGQDKWVYVYRLLTCGTVEEKIYRRQIFKTGLTMQAVAKKEDPTRYFTGQQLRELFILDDPTYSKTFLQVEALHGHQKNVHPLVIQHKQDICKMKSIYDVSEHDLLYTIVESKPQLTPEDEEALRASTSSMSDFLKRMNEERAKLRVADQSRHLERLAMLPTTSKPRVPDKPLVPNLVIDLSSDDESEVVHVQNPYDKTLIVEDSESVVSCDEEDQPMPSFPEVSVPENRQQSQTPSGQDILQEAIEECIVPYEECDMEVNSNPSDSDQANEASVISSDEDSEDEILKRSYRQAKPQGNFSSDSSKTDTRDSLHSNHDLDRNGESFNASSTHFSQNRLNESGLDKNSHEFGRKPLSQKSSQRNVNSFLDMEANDDEEYDGDEETENDEEEGFDESDHEDRYESSFIDDEESSKDSCDLEVGDAIIGVEGNHRNSDSPSLFSDSDVASKDGSSTRRPTRPYSGSESEFDASQQREESQTNVRTTGPNLICRPSSCPPVNSFVDGLSSSSTNIPEKDSILSTSLPSDLNASLPSSSSSQSSNSLIKPNQNLSKFKSDEERQPGEPDSTENINIIGDSPPSDHSQSQEMNYSYSYHTEGEFDAFDEDKGSQPVKMDDSYHSEGEFDEIDEDKGSQPAVLESKSPPCLKDITSRLNSETDESSLGHSKTLPFQNESVKHDQTANETNSGLPTKNIDLLKPYESISNQSTISLEPLFSLENLHSSLSFAKSNQGEEKTMPKSEDRSDLFSNYREGLNDEIAQVEHSNVEHTLLLDPLSEPSSVSSESIIAIELDDQEDLSQCGEEFSIISQHIGKIRVGGNDQKENWTLINPGSGSLDQKEATEENYSGKDLTKEKSPEKGPTKEKKSENPNDSDEDPEYDFISQSFNTCSTNIHATHDSEVAEEETQDNSDAEEGDPEYELITQSFMEENPPLPTTINQTPKDNSSFNDSSIYVTARKKRNYRPMISSDESFINESDIVNDDDSFFEAQGASNASQESQGINMTFF